MPLVLGDGVFRLGAERQRDAGVCRCVLHRFKAGVWVSCGVFMRALLDFFGTKLFGNNAFTFTVAACIVYALAERFDFDGIFPQIFTVFGLTFVVGALNSLLLVWFTSSSMWPGFWSLLGGSALGAVLAPAVFWTVRRVLGKGAVCRQA